MRIVTPITLLSRKNFAKNPDFYRLGILFVITEDNHGQADVNASRF
jgi:hypothetical protein